MYFIEDSRSQLLLSLISLAVVVAAYFVRKRRREPATGLTLPGGAS
jgi:hypothetical protein